MAEIIPMLNQQSLSRMTNGEKRLARRLQSMLENDYLVWYDIPVGKKRRYPDFIILHPSRGLLFLEVKDWKPNTLKKISKTGVELLTGSGLVRTAHPLDQARQYAYAVLNVLQRDPRLIQSSGKHKGNLIMPYGWGAVLTNMTRQQIQKAIPDDKREILLPDHLIIYKDEMTENADAEKFQEQLWGMFHYQFGNKLTLPQINQVRWHLFPEIRIDSSQEDLFVDDSKPDIEPAAALPEVIRIMDIQQEQLARSMGAGHRVIHGVSGSGKTLILGYRCLQLAQTIPKPILVLCYNITLAAKLRAFMNTKGIGGQVQVYHFHDWCGEQLKTYHVEIKKSDHSYFERQVESVIDAVDKGRIPRAQYGALLIDEGHDFEADWLRLVVQMIDPDTDSLLLLYDDAQSLYSKPSGLGFTLSSVGIKAKGRTSILRLNYRNTREILAFAYRFVQQYLDPHSADDDHIPLLEPKAAGTSGCMPVTRQFDNFDGEVRHAIKCVQTWQGNKVPLRDMAVLVVQKWQGDALAKQFKAQHIPHTWLADKQRKQAYDSAIEQVTISTIHSSKGLEFLRVMILGIGALNTHDEEKSNSARLLYVGMTRAQQYLLMTTSASEKDKHEFSQALLKS